MVRRLTLVLMAICLILSGCSKKETVVPTLAEPVGTDIDTAVVSHGDIYDLNTYDAKVYPDIQELSFAIDGMVKEMAVTIGQEVKKGDLLISLEDETAKEELKRLKEELIATQKNNDLENKKMSIDMQMQELGILQRKEEQAPAIEIAKLEAELEKRKLKKEHALEIQLFNQIKVEKKIEDIESELDKYKLMAPCSGRITYIKQISMHSKISANETVIIIADESKLHIQSDFISAGELTTASQIYALIKGKEYTIESIPFETNEIIKMNNSGTKLETSYNFIADADIAAGDYACVCLINKLKQDVLMIPKNALYNDSEGDFVYRIHNGELVRCNVVLGTKTDIQVEIIEGLEEGDVVYVQK